MPFPMRRFASPLALLALAAAPARAEWVEWIADASLAAEFTDNLNQTAFRDERESDVVWSSAAALGRIYQAGDRTRLGATFDATGALFSRFDRLDSVSLGGTGFALHKFGIGDEVPWARAEISAWQQNFKEDVRDSWFWETRLEAGKALSPRLDTSLSWSYTSRQGGNGPRFLPGVARDVFDQDGHTLRLEGSYLLAEPALVTLGAEYYAGDFESACPRSKTPNLQRIRPAAVALDEVFGKKASDCIYRIDGDVLSGFVRLGLVLSRRVDLELGYRFRHGDARRLDYQTHLATVTLSYRY